MSRGVPQRLVNGPEVLRWFWAHPPFANRYVVLRNDEEFVRVSLDEDDYR